MRASLAELIERLSQFPHAVNSDISVSWHAHREAEQLEDVTMARELDAYLHESPTRERRSAAYFIIGSIGRNCGSPECGSLLVAHISLEQDRDALTDLLRALREVPKTAQVDLAPVFALLRDKRSFVRRAAIASLINTESLEAEDRVLEVLRSSAHPSDTVCCHSTLNRIGTAKALPALEVGLTSRKRDVKLTARAAMEAITKRHSE